MINSYTSYYDFAYQKIYSNFGEYVGDLLSDESRFFA